MGKHAAAEGASAHPIVAAALAARPVETGGAHSADGAPAGGENPLGWPAPPAPGGGGLGWPADADTVASAPARVDAPPAARRSWRRLFGAGRVA